MLVSSGLWLKVLLGGREVGELGMLVVRGGGGIGSGSDEVIIMIATAEGKCDLWFVIDKWINVK